MQIRGFDEQFSALRHGVSCIDYKVYDHLLDLALLRLDLRQFLRQLGGELDMHADQPLEHRPHIGDQRVEIENLGLQRLAGG